MKLFISYAREDTDFAKYLHKYLKDKDHEVFIDVNSISIGESWSNSIEKNISDCDIFLVILTYDSLSSQNVENEVYQAQRKTKTIVPCIHEDLEDNDIKWGLQLPQGIKFSDEYKLARTLYSKIKNYVNIENEKSSFVPQQKIILDTNFSKDTVVLLEKGNALYNQGKYQEAIEWYDQVLQTDPNNETARYNRFLANEYLSKGKQGYTVPKRSQENNFLKDAVELTKIGNALCTQGKYQEGVQYFDKALSIDPKNVKALLGKGGVLAFQDKYHESLEYFDKALRIDPKNGVALFSKGATLYQQNKYHESLEYFDKALRIDPNNDVAQNYKAKALKRISEHTHAKTSPTDIKILEDIDSFYKKGLALLKLGEYHEAIEWFDKALRIDPNYKGALNDKGAALVCLGEYQEAIEWFDKALRIDPNSNIYRKNKELALERLVK